MVLFVKRLANWDRFSSHWLLGFETFAGVNWNFSSHLRSFLSSDQISQSHDLIFMVLDLSIHVMVLTWCFSHHAVMRSASHLSLLWASSGHFSGRPTHLDRLLMSRVDGLVDRIDVIVDLLSSSLLDRLGWGLSLNGIGHGLHNVRALHLNLLLVSHLVDHSSLHSSALNTEFAEEEGKDGSSDDESPSEHVVESLSFVFSFLFLFFSQILAELIFLIS